MQKISLTLKIGILLSILWIVFAGLYMYNLLTDNAHRYADNSYSTCLMMEKKEVACAAEKLENIASSFAERNKTIAGVTLVPLPFIWLSYFVLVYFYKILRAGFRSEIAWKTLTKTKKTFTVICCSFVLFVLIFVAFFIAMMAVDLKVPVSLPIDSATVHVYPTLASASGTWAAVGSDSAYPIPGPLQTSKIECDRNTMKCIEAIAFIFKDGNSLSVLLLEYEVQKWTDTSIVAVMKPICFDRVLSIDSATKQASIVNVDREIKNCMAVDETRYTLVSGWDIYKKERQKAHSWFLSDFIAVTGMGY